MDKTNKKQLLFYQKIGALFYAIAATDKVVHKSEYKALSKLVEAQWKEMDEYQDSFGKDAAYQISIVFEWFDYEAMDAYQCFEDFASYYKSHPSLFTTERKKLIKKTASDIANAFSGLNKSELVMIAKLDLLFKI